MFGYYGDWFLISESVVAISDIDISQDDEWVQVLQVLIV